MKIIFMTAFLLFATFTFGQEKDKKLIFNRKHEVKLGALKLLSGSIFEGTYEYIYSKDFTYGGSILVADAKNWNESFSLTPYTRFYFLETKEYGAKGFFVEGFGKFSTGSEKYDYYYYEDNRSYSAFAIGFGVGKKWINNSGFVFEFLIGGARTIGGGSNAPDGFFRGDINLGYRF